MHVTILVQAQVEGIEEMKASKSAKSPFWTVVALVVSFFVIKSCIFDSTPPSSSVTGSGLETTVYVSPLSPPTLTSVSPPVPISTSSTISVPPPVPTLSWEQIQAQKISNAIDFTNPTTRNYAVKLAALSPGKYNIEQICDIYEAMYDSWKYVSDPNKLDY